MLTKKILSLTFFFLSFVIVVEIIFIVYFNSKKINLVKYNNQTVNNSVNNFSNKEIAEKYTVPYILILGSNADNKLINPKNTILQTEFFGKIHEISFSKEEIDGFSYSFFITIASETTGFKNKIYFNDRHLEILKLSWAKDISKKITLKDLKKGDQIKMKMKTYLFYPPDKNLIDWEIIKLN